MLCTPLLPLRMWVTSYFRRPREMCSFPNILSYLTEDFLKHLLSKTAETNNYQLKTSKLSQVSGVYHNTCLQMDNSSSLEECQYCKSNYFENPGSQTPSLWVGLFFLFDITPQHLSCTASKFCTAFSMSSAKIRLLKHTAVFDFYLLLPGSPDL